VEGLSRMMGNYQVRFLGEEAAATPPPYPTGLVTTLCPEQRSVLILAFPSEWPVTRCPIPVAAPGLTPSRMSTRKRTEAFHVQSLVGDRQRKRIGPQHR
jgi:hypothetical protein